MADPQYRALPLEAIPEMSRHAYIPPRNRVAFISVPPSFIVATLLTFVAALYYQKCSMAVVYLFSSGIT